MHPEKLVHYFTDQASLKNPRKHKRHFLVPHQFL